MDLRLFGRVLWRFRYLMAIGAVLAVVLSAMTVVKLPSFAPRTQHLYATSATLFVTQSGFPWGSALQQYQSSGNGGPTPAGDLGRLTSLANLYVQLANSDLIRMRVLHHEPAARMLSATQNYSYSPSFSTYALPLITLTGTSTSPAKSRATTQAGVAVLSSYLRQNQRASGIDKTSRVVLQEIEMPRVATLVNPTKKTLPVVVFLTIMLAVTGLAFVLENLRPRPREAEALKLPAAEAESEPLAGTSRRSA